MKKIDYTAEVHYKTYMRFERIELPDYRPETHLQKLIKGRRSRRFPSDRCIDRAELHRLIDIAAGITGSPDTKEKDFRAYPSAGARYPLELYVLSFRVEDMEKGIYHYSPADRTLEVLLKDDILKETDAAMDGALDGFSDIARALVIATAVPMRTTYKYGPEGAIFPYIEAGLLMENLTLLLEEAGINSVMLGVQWSRDALASLLDINPMREDIVASLAVL